MTTKTMVYRTVKSMNNLWPKKTITENAIEKSISDSSRCFTCGSVVYAVEEKKTANHIYHNRCFRCRICKRNLNGLSLNEEGDDIYCSNCYQKKQRGDCDSLDFKLAALERGQFVYNRRHPDEREPQPNPQPPIQRDLSRQPSWTLRQIERGQLSNEKLDPDLKEKVRNNYQKLISVTHPIKIETISSAPPKVPKFRFELSIPSDRSPSFSRIVRTPSLPKTDRSPSLSKTDRSPSFSRIVRTPSLPKTDRSPSFSRIVRTPSLPKTDRSPSFSRIERSPSLSKTDRSSSLSRIERSPSLPRSDWSPSLSRIERTPSIPGNGRSPSLHFLPVFSPFPNAQSPSKVSTLKTDPSIKEIKIHNQLPRSKSYSAEIFRFPSIPEKLDTTYVSKLTLGRPKSIIKNETNKISNRRAVKQTRFSFPSIIVRPNRSQSVSTNFNFDKYRLN